MLRVGLALQTLSSPTRIFNDFGYKRTSCRSVNANKTFTLPHAQPQKNRNLVKALKTTKPTKVGFVVGKATLVNRLNSSAPCLPVHLA
jgi:hypothetical protein